MDQWKEELWKNAGFWNFFYFFFGTEWKSFENRNITRVEGGREDIRAIDKKRREKEREKTVIIWIIWLMIK